MFLHASQTGITHPDSGKALRFEAPLPVELEATLTYLNQDHGQTI